MARTRAPNGVVNNKPIALRLLPDELEQIKNLAATEKRPMANMCRILVTQGLAQHKANATS